MHFDFKGIMEGAFNSIFVNAKIEEIAKERMEHCNVCPHMSENRATTDPNFKRMRPDKYCTLCGCNLHMKTRSLSQVCPDFIIGENGVQIPNPRWNKLIEDTEEQELDNRLTQDKLDIMKANTFIHESRTQKRGK